MINYELFARWAKWWEVLHKYFNVKWTLLVINYFLSIEAANHVAPSPFIVCKTCDGLFITKLKIPNLSAKNWKHKFGWYPFTRAQQNISFFISLVLWKQFQEIKIFCFLHLCNRHWRSNMLWPFSSWFIKFLWPIKQFEP